jgi:hypothetical protein
MKHAIALAIIFVVGFVLFDAQAALGLWATYGAGYALTCIPSKVWLAIGEAFAEMMPWIWIGLLS